MHDRFLIVGMLFWVPVSVVLASSGEVRSPYARPPVDERAVGQRWLSEDLHLGAGELLSYKAGTGQHLLVFRNGFSMAVAGGQYTSDSAVVWIETPEAEGRGSEETSYQIQAYLAGQVSSKRDGATARPDFEKIAVEKGKALVVKARFGGEVYVTAETRETKTPQDLPLYARALKAFESAGLRLPPPLVSPGPPSPAAQAVADKPKAGYTVLIAPLSDVAPTEELSKSADGVQTITVIGRIFVSWQEQGETAGESKLMELQADTAVLWRQRSTGDPQGADLGPVQHEAVSAIYVAGDVVMGQGQHSIRADELYYDLRNRRGLAKNAVMRSYDASRNIPVYVRAAELRQEAANQFEATDITLTTSEFWKPQISVKAAKARIIDKTGQTDGTSDADYDAELKDVAFKYYDTTLLGLPSVRSNLQAPDVPLRNLRVGSDSTYGASLETRWFLGRVLGLHEPEGTESTLMLDYYSKRGLGGGFGIDYKREDYFGQVMGYVINDHGEDRLGRTRKSVPVPDDTRGRFEFRHRHFLPYNWQMTAEASYISDKNFLEQFYRTEFYSGKEQETLLHLKRIEDNWGFSLLGKARINDFINQVEELPTAEFHWTGQSLLQDRLTFFSDSQISRYRYLYSSEGPGGDPGGFFTFTTTRNELDLPLTLGKTKIVPFVAGTFGFEDGIGFDAELDGPAAGREDAVLIGEAGVRMSTQPYWRVYPDVKSRLWDLEKLRHVVRPRLAAVAYAESDRVAEQRDTLNLGLTQRWQTKRGPLGRKRTVDWLEINTDVVWVANSGDASSGPDQFIWNKPFIPLVNRAGHMIPPQDRRTTDIFGPRRNYVGADMTLRLSDTTSILGDMNIDMQSGVFQQVNVGVSRLCWPNLSYYLGSRYLRRLDNGLGEHGSNAVTFAATYILDPRYTAVFSQQYDFDYGASIRSDITLIRKYHRVSLALTLGSDDSLDEQTFMLSLWPQGVPELAIGQRRYMGLGASETF